MTKAKKTFKIVGIVLLLPIVFFLAGRFGWKVFGFGACQSAGIKTVEVGEGSVEIVGFYPGSFPEGFSGGGLPADGGVWETGKYIFMDNDIMMAAKDAEVPISFTITAKGAYGTVAVGEFQFDADKEKMFLTITADGRIEEDIQDQAVEISETYPEADVVELVNLTGDTTTAYKLLDGRYMDRIDRIFVFDGTDTWTDENGVEWNEVVK